MFGIAGNGVDALNSAGSSGRAFYRIISITPHKEPEGLTSLPLYSALKASSTACTPCFPSYSISPVCVQSRGTPWCAARAAAVQGKGVAAMLILSGADMFVWEEEV